MHEYSLKRWVEVRFKRGDRFYCAELKQNLFHQWVVVRRWGGTVSGRWGTNETPCESYEEGLRIMERIGKRRAKRDYRPK